MLDNDYINYSLATILLIIVGTFFYHLIKLAKKASESLSSGVSRLKPIGDGVENINNVITDNMENISSGVSNLSSIAGSIQVLIENISQAFASKQPVKAELRSPLDGPVNELLKED